MTQDALLLAAKWRQEFKNDDVPLPFTSGDGTTADIDALGGILTIPYATDDNLAMDVILPERGTHPNELDFDTINASVSALSEISETRVDLTMPPSDITTKWDLLEPLAGQGIDLSEMDGIFGGATTDQVAQQVRLTVTAKGTVGGRPHGTRLYIHFHVGAGKSPEADRRSPLRHARPRHPHRLAPVRRHRQQPRRSTRLRNQETI